MPEQDTDLLEILICEVGQDTQVNFSAKRWAYSDMPSFRATALSPASPPRARLN
jgi:hypothetical protein